MTRRFNDPVRKVMVGLGLVTLAVLLLGVLLGTVIKLVVGG